MAEHVQTVYRRTSKPFLPGQIADGSPFQLDSGRLVQSSNSLSSLPFGYAVGWVDGPADTDGRTLLKGNVCSRFFTTSSGNISNFAGVAVKNIALPGTNSPVDTYNEDDIVSIGVEGDFIVVCQEAVSVRNPVYVFTSTASNNANYGKFIGAAGATRGLVDGAVFMTDSTEVALTNGETVHLASVRIRMQPR